MNRRGYITKLIPLMVLLLTVAGCFPSYILVPVRKPAQIDISGVRKIAVVDFQGPENSGAISASMLTTKLFETKHFQIYERKQISQILEEHKLAMAGVVDVSSAKEVGLLLGVDALIFGEVTAYSLERDEAGTEKVQKKVGTGKFQTVTRGKKQVREEIMRTVLVDQSYKIRRGAVGATFRMVHMESGELLAVKENTKSYDSGKVVEGRGTLKPKEQVLNDLLESVTGAFVKQVAPYVVNEKRQIEGGKGPMKVGKKYAESGLWEEALKAFEQAVQAEPANPSAHYNLGLAYEVLGDLDAAEAEYQKAINLKDKDLYFKSLARLRKAREEAKRLQEQIGT